ncbi:MAG: winged helix-turn-helix transcriptional regulator [Nitrososphaeraceae archaeon]|nr:winged helix-turn-helix transcriptional regulator [Nitrososphaeraceae archaeon]
MEIMAEPGNTALNKEVLNDIQSKLLKYIRRQSGVRYRELLRLAGLSNGVLTYNILSLEKSNHIIVDRNSKSNITRYYPNSIPTEQSNIIGHIRIYTARQIILCMLEYNKPCTFNEIVKYTNKAQSTISWHLKRLKDAGIVSVQYSHHHQYHQYLQLYKLTDGELVTDVLYKYKESFMDKVVNNYTEIVEDL